MREELNQFRTGFGRETRSVGQSGWLPPGRDAVQVLGAPASSITATNTNKSATVSAEIIKQGLDEGYFETPIPKGPFRVAFPAKVHESYFPQLFLGLPVEPPAERSACMER